MRCPDCGAATKVVDSRQRGARKYRRHKCPEGHKFSTYEIYESEIPLDVAGVLTESAIGILVARSVARALPQLLDEITREIIEGVSI